MFIQRLLVILVFGPAALFAIYRGGLFYFLPLAIILVLATIEYSQIMQRLGWQVSHWLLIPAVLLQLVAGQWPATSWSRTAGINSQCETRQPRRCIIWLYSIVASTRIIASGKK